MRIVRISLALLVGLCIMFGTSNAFGQTTTFRLKVKVQAANVRMGPSLDSAVVAAIPRGETFESSGKEGSWFRIAVPERFHKGKPVGFVHESTVDLLPNETKTKVITEQDPRPAGKTETKEMLEPPVQTGQADEVSWVINKGGKAVKGGSKSNRKPLALSFGLRTGFDLASLSADPAWNGSAILRMEGGGWVSAALSPKATILVGIDLVKRGGSLIDQEWEWRWTVSYLQIPVLFRYQVFTSSTFSVCAQAGVYTALRLAAKEYMANTDHGFMDEGDWLGVKTIDFGLILGSVLKYALSQGLSVLAEIRYGLGIPSVGWSMSFDRAKNRYLSIAVGIELSSKK